MYYLVLAVGLLIQFTMNIYMLKKNRYLRNQYAKYQELAAKNDRLFKMAIECASRNIDNNCIYSYLKSRDYNSIIVYGLHYAGELVVNSLKGTDIKVVCGIDKNAKNIVNGLLIIHPNEDFPKADAIVVTAVTAFIEIDEFLYEKVDCPIISLEDIIYSGGMTK